MTLESRVTRLEVLVFASLLTGLINIGIGVMG